MPCMTHLLSLEPLKFVLFITSPNAYTPQSDTRPVRCYDLFLSFTSVSLLRPGTSHTWIFLLGPNPLAIQLWSPKGIYKLLLSKWVLSLRWFSWVLVQYSDVLTRCSSYPLTHIQTHSSCIAFMSHGVTSAIQPMRGVSENLQVSFWNITNLAEPSKQNPNTTN